MRSRPAPWPPATVEADVGAVLEAEAISKLYPSRPVTIFPPVRSIFEREFGFPGRRSSEEEKKEDVRTRSFAAAEYDLGLGGDDEDEEDDDDDLEQEPGQAPAEGPDETVWVLRDVSLRVSPGDSVGIVGGPDAGKSTLLRILAGRAFPTEGRVVAQGRVAPLAADVRKALGLASKVGGHNPVLAMRLLGIDAATAKQHRSEIEELAEPLLTPDGDPAPGAAQRLAVASTVVVPSDVILLDGFRGLDDTFVSLIVERLRERLGEGSALVLASRDTSLARQLCGRLLLLEGGSLAELGDSSAAVASYNGAAGADRSATRAAAASATIPDGASPSVPAVVRAFNASAALLSAEVQTAFGARSKLFDSRDELRVEVRLETAVRDAEVRCGICFTPRDGGIGFRTELAEPLVVPRPRTHVLVAHFPPGTLPNSGYEVRADATVAVAGEREATLIARVAGRFRIEGDDLGFTEPTEPPAPCWDGTSTWPVEAEWSIRQERRGR